MHATTMDAPLSLNRLPERAGTLFAGTGKFWKLRLRAQFPR